MLILWITRKKENPTPPAEVSGEALRQHNTAMEKFRRAHPALNIVNARDIVLADGALLAPVDGVSLDGNARN
jgi:hypothetical protein